MIDLLWQLTCTFADNTPLTACVVFVWGFILAALLFVTCRITDCGGTGINRCLDLAFWILVVLALASTIFLAAILTLYPLASLRYMQP